VSSSPSYSVGDPDSSPPSYSVLARSSSHVDTTQHVYVFLDLVLDCACALCTILTRPSRANADSETIPVLLDAAPPPET